MSTVEAPFVSRTVQAARGSGSLRVTIPQVIAATLELKPGDELEWRLEPDRPVVHVAKRPPPAVPSPAGVPFYTFPP